MFSLNLTNRSKKDLIKDCMTQLTEKERAESEFEQLRGIVREASEEYARCKRHFFLVRNRDVRKMIKGCTNAEMLKGLSDRSVCVEDSSRGARDLLTAASNFRIYAKENLYRAETRHNLESLSKDELTNKVEKIRTETDTINRKCDQGREKLKKLKRSYEISKHHIYPTRYFEFKDMMKKVIRDDLFFE